MKPRPILSLTSEDVAAWRWCRSHPGEPTWLRLRDSYTRADRRDADLMLKRESSYHVFKQHGPYSSYVVPARWWVS